MAKYRNYTDEDVVKAVAESVSVGGTLRKLDLVPAGGNYSHLYKTIQKLGISTDHWTGKAWAKDKQLKNWESYSRASNLRKHLIALRDHKCNKCGRTEWMGNPIPLEVHHADGDRTNNDLVNLEVLCLNCHALTDNWRKAKDV